MDNLLISPESVIVLRDIATGSFSSNDEDQYLDCLSQLQQNGLIDANITYKDAPGTYWGFAMDAQNYAITEKGKGFLYGLTRDDEFREAVRSMAQTAKETAEDARQSSESSRTISIFSLIVAIISVIIAATK